jgi:hypothetical protein
MANEQEGFELGFDEGRNRKENKGWRLLAMD